MLKKPKEMMVIMMGGGGGGGGEAQVSTPTYHAPPMYCSYH